MLKAVGIEPDEERVYRLLIETFDGSPGRLAGRLGLSADTAVDILEALRTKGLVSRRSASPPRYVPTPPDVAFGPILLRSQEELERARREVARLTEDYRTGVCRRDVAHLVEIITGQATIRQHLENLQRGAREEIVWLCKAGHVALPSSENTEELTALARGVRYRVIYERALLEEPGMIANVALGIRHGELARTIASLPIRLAIADRSLAVCPLVTVADGRGEPTAALIRDSTLLAGLLALFESSWSRASPLRLSDATTDGSLHEVAVERPLADDERYLLSLLVAGVADKAIASQLGLSQRTVQRRIYELMRRANVETRTQLAWQAARLGWLDD